MELASLGLKLAVKYCDERIVCLSAGEYLEYQMSKLLHIFDACCLWRRDLTCLRITPKLFYEYEGGC